MARWENPAGPLHINPPGGVTAPALDSGLRRKDELDRFDSDHLGSNGWTPWLSEDAIARRLPRMLAGGDELRYPPVHGCLTAKRGWSSVD